jgi:hypothetical protein
MYFKVAFLIIIGSVWSVASLKTDEPNLEPRPAAEFVQVITYKDVLCTEPSFGQIVQLNYCGPSAVHGEFSKVTIHVDATKGIYEATDTFYSDAECTQLSTIPPRSRTFPSRPCQGSMSAEIVAGIPSSPPADFDFSLRHYDTMENCK